MEQWYTGKAFINEQKRWGELRIAADEKSGFPVEPRNLNPLDDHGEKIVFTIGIREREQEFVNIHFACGGQVVDISGEYEKIFKAPHDRIIIIEDAVSPEMLRTIMNYREAEKKSDNSEYYFYTRSDWNELYSTYQKEKTLLQEWKIRWKTQHSEYRFFNADGIVDYARWSKIPEGKRILVVLKETNGLEGDLTTFLRRGGSNTYYRTWNNVARWVCMLLYQTYLEHVPKTVLDDMVKNIAAVNLKKYPGGARANNQQVKNEARKDIDLLRKQITLYSPDIILTCGWGLISDFLHDEVFQDTAPWYDPGNRADKENDPNLWYFRTDKVRSEKPTLLISMPHPNRAAKKWTYELQKVYKKFRGSDPLSYLDY